MPVVREQADYVTKIQDKLNFADSVSPINESDLVSALDDAVDQYSRDKPYEKIHAITGVSGTVRYALPSDWDDRFSYILYIESPAGEQNPVLLDVDEVFVWEDSTDKQFQFVNLGPGTGDIIWVKYTLRHTLDSTTNTIPDADFEAVSFLGTAFAALNAAGQLLKPRSQTTSVSGLINFRTTSDEYKSFAQEMLKHYYRRLGISPEGPQTKAFLSIFDLDPISAAWGFGWLTHPSR